MAFGVDNTFALAGARRGRVRAVRRDAAGGRRRSTLLDGDDDQRADADRQRQRLRQRRRHLVRRPRRRAADDPRRPRRSRRTRTCSSPPAPRPARRAWRSCWPRSRRTATTGRTTGRELMANGAKLDRRLVGRLPGRLHPGRRQGRPADRAVLRLLAGVHRRRRRRRPRPARCSTPASARSSTPACSPAPRTRTAPRRWSTSCSADEVQAALPDSMYVFPVDSRRRAAGRLGEVRRAADRRRTRSTRPTIAAHRDEWLREWSDVTTPVSAAMRRVAHPRRRWRRCRCAVLGVFFVLPVSGMLARGVLGRRHASTPAAVAEVLGPAADAPGHLVHGLVGAGGHGGVGAARRCPRRTCCTGWRFRGRGVLRALLLVPFVLPTVVVGVAFRQLLGEAGPLGFLGLDGTAGAIVAGLVVLQRRRRDPRGRRRVGVARPAAGRGGGRARAPARRRCFRTVTLPALRPGDRVGGERGLPLLRHRVRRGADPRRAALLLGRDRDLPAHHQPARPARPRPRCRSCSCSRSPRCWSSTGRLRAVPDPSRGADARPRPRRPRAATGRGLLRDRAGAACWSRLPIATLVVGSLQVDDGWSLGNYRALTTDGSTAGAAGAGDRRAGHLAADRGRRDLDVAAARAAGRGRGDPPLAHAAAERRVRGGCSTASSCCRSGSPR